MMTDLHIIYRIYPKVSKVPPVYKDNKLELVMFCFNSFCLALKGKSVKISVLFDNCPVEFYSSIEKIWKFHFDTDIELITVVENGNYPTFKKQLNLLINSNAKYLMFAEDDYYYFPNSIEKLLNAMDDTGHGIGSLYDHPDYYSNIIHGNDTMLYYSNHFFRLSRTTCLTFVIKNELLSIYRNIFAKYSDNFMDYTLWLCITSNFNYLIRKIFKVKNKNELIFVLSILRDIIKNSGLNFFTKKRKIITPVPTLSLHLESDFLSYGYDWNDLLIEVVELWENMRIEIFKS